MLHNNVEAIAEVRHKLGELQTELVMALLDTLGFLERARFALLEKKSESRSSFAVLSDLNRSLFTQRSTFSRRIKMKKRRREREWTEKERKRATCSFNWAR